MYNNRNELQGQRRHRHRYQRPQNTSFRKQEVVLGRLCAELQLKVKPFWAVLLHEVHEPVAEGRQLQEVRFEDFLADVVVVLGLRVHALTVGVFGVVRELSAIIEGHEKLTFVEVVALEKDVCQFLVAQLLHLAPVVGLIRANHIITNEEYRLFTLKDPKNGVLRDVFEGKESLSFDLAVPHLDFKEEWNFVYQMLQ